MTAATFVQHQLGFASGFGTFVSPTRKLRHTDHDGLRDTATGIRGPSFDIDEGSVFANGSYDVPGTVFGGRVRVSGLAGYAHLSQDVSLPGNFETKMDMAVYGGSYLWTSGTFYTMSVIIGLDGEADARNGGDAYDFDVAGYFTNSVVGNTFELAQGWKFDLRGGVGYYDVESDRYVVPGDAGTSKAVAEAWNASLTGTLFTLVEVGGGTMRPYLLGAYKRTFDEEIEILGANPASYEQADDYGKAEIGFDYVQGAVTYGAAGYSEFSADDTTFGLRLGASVKLQ